jgi:hypothetical protein
MTNDPRRPGEQYSPDNDNTRMGWATAALIAVGLFGFVWGLSSRDTIIFDPLATTGQGNSVGSLETPAAPTTPNLYGLLRSISVDFMRK